MFSGHKAMFSDHNAKNAARKKAGRAQQSISDKKEEIPAEKCGVILLGSGVRYNAKRYLLSTFVEGEFKQYAQSTALFMDGYKSIKVDETDVNVRYWDALEDDKMIQHSLFMADPDCLMYVFEWPLDEKQIELAVDTLRNEYLPLLEKRGKQLPLHFVINVFHAYGYSAICSPFEKGVKPEELEGKRKELEDRMKNAFEKYEIKCSTCSVQTGEGVKEVFDETARLVPGVREKLKSAREEVEAFRSKIKPLETRYVGGYLFKETRRAKHDFLELLHTRSENITNKKALVDLCIKLLEENTARETVLSGYFTHRVKDLLNGLDTRIVATIEESIKESRSTPAASKR